MSLFADNLQRSLAGEYFLPGQIDDFIRQALGDPAGWKIYHRRNHPALYNYPAAFDTEFSSFDLIQDDGSIRSCGTVYLWGFGLNGLVTVGRSTEQFRDWLLLLAQKLGCGSDLNLRPYVHNLGADFQYIRKWLSWTNVFAREERQPMAATTESGIEFRDSLCLVGMSLDSWGKDLLRYKVTKATGSLDYHLMRHSDTPISEEEMGYMIRDCLVVMAGIQEKMDAEGGRLDRVPMTKTGYARRLCRKACLYPKIDKPEGKESKADRKARHDAEKKLGRRYWYLMRKLTLTTEEFKLARRAFQGGFTHSNSGYVLSEEPMLDVDSYDFASSYPAQMVMSNEYPMGRGVKVNLRGKRYDDVLHIMSCYFCMFRVRFEDLEPIITQDNYLSLSKCLSCEEPVLNNGRIAFAKSAELVLTNIDFDIVRRCYTWKRIAFGNFWRYQRGYLPKPIIETVLQLYQDKSTLKGVEGMEEKYQLSKQLLNSLFGMMVTDPCRPEVIYSDDWQPSQTITAESIEEAVNAYNDSDTRFTSYLWGIVITALSRRALWSGILECKQDYLYSDTDSLKILHGEDHAAYIKRYNDNVNKRMELAAERVGFDVRMTRPVTADGKQKFLGHWDYEGRYDRFQARGAKRYMVQHGYEMSLTVSGINKYTAIPYLLRSSGVDTVEKKGHLMLADPDSAPAIFAQFVDGMTIPGSYMVDGKEINASGKMLHKYCDEETSGIMVDYLGNRASYHELSSLYLAPTSYQMGMNADFIRFCMGITVPLIK